MRSFTLGEIAAVLGCPAPTPAVTGDTNPAITGVASLSDATATEISFATSEAYARELPGTRAAAVIVPRKLRLPEGVSAAVLAVDDAELAVARVLKLFAPPVPAPPQGRDPAARIAETAQVSPDAAIGPYVVIGQRTRIGRKCVLHAGVVIGDDVVVGDDCQFFANVVIRERITIGSRVIIHAGSVLGTDGFGYRWDGSRHEKVPQIGTVVIEDDVEIGSCVCIDRAKMSQTRIGRGTKIDNLVQIGHNVRVGPHCIIVGQAGIAGSATLGAGVVLGGQSAVRDHMRLGDGAMLAACSGVMEDVEPRQVVSGLPALPHRQSLREQAALRRLPDLVTQVRKLTEELEAIKKAMGEKA